MSNKEMNINFSITISNMDSTRDSRVVISSSSSYTPIIGEGSSGGTNEMSSIIPGVHSIKLEPKKSGYDSPSPSSPKSHNSPRSNVSGKRKRDEEGKEINILPSSCTKVLNFIKDDDITSSKGTIDYIKIPTYVNSQSHSSISKFLKSLNKKEFECVLSRGYVLKAGDFHNKMVKTTISELREIHGIIKKKDV